MPMPNMITPSSGATCGATQANSPGRQRARAEQAMMMAPMKRVTRALNLSARRGKRALRLLGERGDAQKNVFHILAESANDGKRGRGEGRRVRQNCRIRTGFPAQCYMALRHRAAILKIVLVPAIIILYIRARRTRRKILPARAPWPQTLRSL